MGGHQSRPTPFDNPIQVTRPVLPDLESYMEKLRGIWSAQWLTNAGANHNALEHRLSHELEAPHLSLFNNGTVALCTALKALDIRGEVITTLHISGHGPCPDVEWDHAGLC